MAHHQLRPPKKVLVFSPPFSGHINVLKDLIRQLGQNAQVKLVVTGWANVEPDLSGLQLKTVRLNAGNLAESDPAMWTFPRVAALLDDAITITREFRPDLIIYDMFSVEGRFAGELLDVPYWCSVPALMGAYNHGAYLRGKLHEPVNRQAIASLESRFDITIDVAKLEMVSDGVYMPGQVNLIWSYASVTPPDFMVGRANAPHVFIGSSKAQVHQVSTDSPRPRVYVSLGTVVMGNLWDQHESVRGQLRQFFTRLAAKWAARPWDVTVVTRGRLVFDDTPAGWRILDAVDQLGELARADVFITHGGNNSFHEAIISQVPIAVIPFFGDQPLVARRAQELGIGIDLSRDDDINTHKLQFLADDLVNQLDTAVQELLSDPSYKHKLAALDLTHTNPVDVVRGRLSFAEGDLLFGTNVARARYIEQTGSDAEFQILKFRPFSELVPDPNALPRIVDMYHDVILNDEFFALDTASPHHRYIQILRDYKVYLDGETDFERMCIKGLDFFAGKCQIKFILSDYDPAKNYITTQEIKYILAHAERFASSVTFHNRIAGTWTAVSYEEVANRYRLA